MAKPQRNSSSSESASTETTPVDETTENTATTNISIDPASGVDSTVTGEGVVDTPAAAETDTEALIVTNSGDVTGETEQQPATEITETTIQGAESAAPAVVDAGVADETAEEAAPAEVVVEVATEVEVAAPVAATDTSMVELTYARVSGDFDTLIAGLKETGTKAQKDLIAGIESYMINMAPGRPMPFDVGARQQYTLWKTISGIAEFASEEEFRRLWNILLGFFNTYSAGALGDRYVFRFAEYWTWGDTDLTAFQRLLNLIKLTADPETRKANLRQVSLERSLADGLSEQARQRIVNFYG